ncbi:MAG: glycosyltransferase family 4 protein [Alphaproteobacteria bacterium]
MRIAIQLQSCDETVGGIGIYTQEIVRALLRVDNKNEYVLIYPGFGVARTRRGQFYCHNNVIEIEAELSRLPLRSYWDPLALRVPRVMEKVRALVPLETYWDQVVVPRIAEKYGVDVLFNPQLTIPIRGRFRRVTVMHAVEYHTVPNVYTLRMYAWWFLLEKLILPAADRLISLSSTMTEAVRKHVRYPIAQVRTIYHGVSDKFRVESNYANLTHTRAKYHLPERFILFVGRLYPEKNFAVLAQAFARVKDKMPHRLVVAGQPRYKFKGDIDLLQELDIEDRVDFLDYVPNDELPRIYNLADCFVNPSLYEGFGLAQVEAMACGCPVIAANTGAIPEITGGAAILFDPHSPQELSQAILKVTCEPDVRRQLVDRGLMRARDFTWDRAARATLDVFKELA